MAYPFRLGTTSYIIPADILLNVQYLADKVQDVELVLFEVDDGPNNLPMPEVIDELIELADEHDLTYTVHLPLDLHLGADGDEQHVSLIKARTLIERTRALKPWAYVMHLDGREVKDKPTAEALARWQTQSQRALELVAEWAGGTNRVAVENLERYPLDFISPVLDQLPVGRCVDVGHLWLDGHDPVPYLREALPRTRVIHLHGIVERDHQSLVHMLPEQIDPVIGLLLHQKYAGVLTLEIFGEDDFYSSVAALARSARSIWASA